MSWFSYPSIDFFVPEFKKRDSYKIAIFDLDGTLITRSNGRNPKFSIKENDGWEYLGDIPGEFRDLNKKKWNIVIVTNQLKFNDFVFNQIESVRSDLEEKLGWSPWIFISKSKDVFRKPELGSFELLTWLLDSKDLDVKEFLSLEEKINHDLKIKKVIVSGDAIGKDDPYPPYKWGSADWDFYLNISDKIKPIPVEFIKPIDIFNSNISDVLLEVKKIDVIIMMGMQGSGKTSFSGHLVKTHKILEKDILKNKLKKEAINFLKENKKIVIDKTNPTVQDRKEWIDLSEEYGKSWVIVWMIKSGHSFNEEREKKISSIALNIYTSKFEEPNDEELENLYKVY